MKQVWVGRICRVIHNFVTYPTAVKTKNLQEKFRFEECTIHLVKDFRVRVLRHASVISLVISQILINSPLEISFELPSGIFCKGTTSLWHRSQPRSSNQAVRRLLLLLLKLSQIVHSYPWEAGLLSRLYIRIPISDSKLQFPVPDTRFSCCNVHETLGIFYA